MLSFILLRKGTHFSLPQTRSDYDSQVNFDMEEFTYWYTAQKGSGLRDARLIPLKNGCAANRVLNFLLLELNSFSIICLER